MANIQQAFFLNDSTDLRFIDGPEQSGKTWDRRGKLRDLHQNEWSAFFKDDWKIRHDLTLNIGVRYEYYGVPWDSSFGQGATGASFNSNTGTGTSTTTTIVEPAPRTYTYYQYTEVRPLSDKPIDNGTGPDGKDTFHFYPRPWPYHDLTDVH